MNKPYVIPYHTYTEKPDTDMFNVHFHDNYELYCFLRGSANYFIEGSIYDLKPNDIIIMKKSEAHALLMDKPEPYERITINFNREALFEGFEEKIFNAIDSRPLGQPIKYSFSSASDKNVIKYLKKICKAPNMCEKRLYLTFVLNILSEQEPSQARNNNTDVIDELIDYINEHLFEEMNLDLLAQKFYLSKAHLSRKFKTQVGSTIWEYILTKRLIYANTLLQKGEKASEVATKCGFNDYCSFYRAYKARYNISPRENIAKSYTKKQ